MNKYIIYNVIIPSLSIVFILVIFWRYVGSGLMKRFLAKPLHKQIGIATLVVIIMRGTIILIEWYPVSPFGFGGMHLLNLIWFFGPILLMVAAGTVLSSGSVSFFFRERQQNRELQESGMAIHGFCISSARQAALTSICSCISRSRTTRGIIMDASKGLESGSMCMSRDMVEASK